MRDNKIHYGDTVQNPKLKVLIDQALQKENPTLSFIPHIPRVLTEDEECSLLVDYLLELLQEEKITHFTHIPNETWTPSHNQKRKNKMLGVRPGFPDYVILTPKTPLIIEMKRTKGGVVSEFQQSWVEQLAALRVPVKVCYGFEEAKAFIQSYLE